MKKASATDKRYKPRLGQRKWRAHALIGQGPPLRPDTHLLAAMIPNFDKSPDWLAALGNPRIGHWQANPNSDDDMERLRGAVAVGIIRKLRTQQIRVLVKEGDEHWKFLALNVVRSSHRWHQSTRIRLSAMRSLCQRLAIDGLSEKERLYIVETLEHALLCMVDNGVGEEFRGLAKIAKTIATKALISGLQQRVKNGGEPAVRINAQRMLDCISGKAYRRYRDCV